MNDQWTTLFVHTRIMLPDKPNVLRETALICTFWHGGCYVNRDSDTSCRVKQLKRGKAKRRMKNKGRLAKAVSMLALGLFLVLPAASISAQDWRTQRRRERREERREDRQERREDRQERREERRGRDWNGYGNWGGSFQLRQTGLNAGYNEGIEEGRRDRSRRERFNFTDESDYRSATKDYSSRLGSRSLYQRYFRAGFENGYRDGWNGY